MKKKFKVLITLFLIILVAVILLFIIKPFDKENNVKNEVENSDLAGFKDLEYYSYNINTYELVEDNNTIIYSVDELNKYTSEVRENTLLDALNKYDDSYFSTKSLIVLRVQEISGSILSDVIGVNKDIAANKINVFIKRTAPEIGTTEMVTKNIIIEVNKDDAINVSEIEIAPEGIDY